MMTYFLFAGDMLVMAFMIGIVVYVSLNTQSESLEKTSRIPLEDEETHG